MLFVAVYELIAAVFVVLPNRTLDGFPVMIRSDMSREDPKEVASGAGSMTTAPDVLREFPVIGVRKAACSVMLELLVTTFVPSAPIGILSEIGVPTPTVRTDDVSSLSRMGPEFDSIRPLPKPKP